MAQDIYDSAKEDATKRPGRKSQITKAATKELADLQAEVLGFITVEIREMEAACSTIAKRTDTAIGAL